MTTIESTIADIMPNLNYMRKLNNVHDPEIVPLEGIVSDDEDLDDAQPSSSQIKMPSLFEEISQDSKPSSNKLKQAKNPEYATSNSSKAWTSKSIAKPVELEESRPSKYLKHLNLEEEVEYVKLPESYGNLKPVPVPKSHGNLKPVPVPKSYGNLKFIPVLEPSIYKPVPVPESYGNLKPFPVPELFTFGDSYNLKAPGLTFTPSADPIPPKNVKPIKVDAELFSDKSSINPQSQLETPKTPTTLYTKSINSVEDLNIFEDSLKFNRFDTLKTISNFKENIKTVTVLQAKLIEKDALLEKLSKSINVSIIKYDIHCSYLEKQSDVKLDARIEKLETERCAILELSQEYEFEMERYDFILKMLKDVRYSIFKSVGSSE